MKMDTLTHLTISLAASYVLSRGLGLKVRVYSIIILAVATLAIDIDHFLPQSGVTTNLVFHNIATLLTATMMVWLIFGKDYATLTLVILASHILLDMNYGRYGVPLFYPLSTKTYLIPEEWEIYLFNDGHNPIVSTTGISLSLVMILIVVAALAYPKIPKALSKKG